MIVLNDEVKTSIKLHALREAPNECCGLLLQNEDRLCAYTAKNTADDPAHFFKLDTRDYLSASLMGKIVGFYHSHKSNGSFSEFDKLNSEVHKLASVLYCIENDTFAVYEPQGYEIPYCNREYVHAVVDCFSIVRDYYRRELNATITDITHPYRFVINKADHPDNQIVHTILKDHFINNGFVEVKDIRKHDVLLLKTPLVKSPVHCMIYVGNNQILHHPYGQRSCIELFSNKLKNRTIHILRHRSQV